MTDSKTATERLRELLDARGVKWWEGWNKSQTVFDGANDVRYMADCMLGQLYIRSVLPITLEQAVNATLGNERLSSLEEKAKLQGDYIYKMLKERAQAATLGSNEKLCFATDYTYKHCKYSVDRGWVEDTKFYIPAFYIPTSDTLRSGECKFKPFVGEDWDEPNAVRGVCSECSALMYGKDNFCPNCGKAVKR